MIFVNFYLFDHMKTEICYKLQWKFILFVQKGNGFLWAFNVDYSECFVFYFFNVIHVLGLGMPP